MNEKHAHLLRCPKCKGQLKLSYDEIVDGRIESGTLSCVSCSEDYPIVRYIPRFIELENYSDNFGFQWNKYIDTQLDSKNGTNLSANRFYNSTAWPNSLTGEKVLEVGCGAGRFSEVVVKTGCTLVSFDLSSAVEANYRSNGHHENILILQASIYDMPFEKNSFDKVFCFGVLQHTPNVKKSFNSLVQYLRVGGSLAVDVYRISFLATLKRLPKYFMRIFTRNMDSIRLHNLVDLYVRKTWVFSGYINKLPLGRHINEFFLIHDLRRHYPLSDEILKEWAILDTYDMLSATYDYPKRVSTVRKWFNEESLVSIKVARGLPGCNGIVGKAIKA